VIIDPHERTIVSSLGWIDGGALWVLDVRSNRHRTVRIGDAEHLSLHRGTGDLFAVVHHFDADRVEITGHSFAEPHEVISRCIISGTARRIEGDTTVWSSLPRHYVAYLVQPAWSEFALITVEPDNLSLQTFEWYNDTYDKGYQGIVGVVEVPDSHLTLVSVQRNSEPVIYDPVARRKIGQIALAGNHGNPTLYFRRTERELWADDYDTILKLAPQSWRVMKSRKFQEAAGAMSQFIGQFSFDTAESVCAVARPFSGDVVGLDPRTLRIRYRAKVGKQPLAVAVTRDLRVFARDWDTGDTLHGKFRRVWFG